MGNIFCCCRCEADDDSHPVPTVVGHQLQTVIVRRQPERQWSDLSFEEAKAENPSYVTRWLMNNILKTHSNGWSASLKDEDSYRLVEIYPNSMDYDGVMKKFLDGNWKRFRIMKMSRIENPYLLCVYLLKKEELKSRHWCVEEKIMFHGTTADNIPSIAAENFDWRRCDKKKSKFGQGVNFATNSYYASHYPDKPSSEAKVIIVANVLVCNTLVITENPKQRKIVVPPHEYDSTKNENGQVLVKYDDNEFYPAFVVWYKNVETESKQYDCCDRSYL